MEPEVKPAVEAGTPQGPAVAPEPSTDGTQQDAASKEQAELSRKAAQFSESRKNFASTLVELSKDSEAAKQRLLELAKDDYERGYLNEKFPGYLDSLDGKTQEAQAATPPGMDEKVETMFRERELERKSSLSQVKSNIGLTQDQEGAFDEWVTLYEGKAVGGKTLTFKDAVEMASQHLTPDVPKANIWRGNVNDRPEDQKQQVDVGITQERISANSRYTGAKTAADFADVQSQLSAKGSYDIKLK